MFSALQNVQESRCWWWRSRLRLGGLSLWFRWSEDEEEVVCMNGSLKGRTGKSEKDQSNDVSTEIDSVGKWKWCKEGTSSRAPRKASKWVIIDPPHWTWKLEQETVVIDYNRLTVSKIVAASNLILQGNWQNGVYPNFTYNGVTRPQEHVKITSLCADWTDANEQFWDRIAILCKSETMNRSVEAKINANVFDYSAFFILINMRVQECEIQIICSTTVIHELCGFIQSVMTTWHPHSETRCTTVSHKPQEWMKKNISFSDCNFLWIIYNTFSFILKQK